MKAGRLCLCGITGEGKDGTVMTALYEYLVEKKHHAWRRTLDWGPAEEFCVQGLSPEERADGSALAKRAADKTGGVLSKK